MQKTIQVQVNTSNLIRNMGVMFSNGYKYIAELMQNSRRAGATFVRFSVVSFGNTCTVEVEDDGVGIANMQDLLSIADSGWDGQTIADEAPFGMGFLSALFAAARVRVESRENFVEFNCQDAISLREIQVKPCGNTKTRIVLFGIKQDAAKICDSIKSFAIGFPIEVIVNGESAPRPHAIESLKQTGSYREIDDGFFYLSGISLEEKQKKASTHYSLYFQGLPVSIKGCFSDPRDNVIHLSSKFKVRMPDLDTLVNPEDARSIISENIKKLWIEELESRKRALPAKRFLKENYRTIQLFRHEKIMNDIPFLPNDSVSAFSDVPCEIFEECEYLDGVRNSDDEMITLESVTSGKHVLCFPVYSNSDIQSSEDKDLDVGMAAMYLAYKLGWVCLEKRDFDSGHWVYEHAIDLAEADVRVNYTVKKVEGYSGNYVSADVILVDDYTIHVNNSWVSISDLSLGIGVDYSDGIILVPPKAGTTREGLLCISNYRDSDTGSFDSNGFPADREGCDRAVASMLGEPAEISVGKTLQESEILHFNNCKTAAVVAFMSSGKLKTESLGSVLKRFSESANGLQTDQKLLDAIEKAIDHFVTKEISETAATGS